MEDRKTITACGNRRNPRHERGRNPALDLDHDNSSRSLSSDELRLWLRLAHTDGIGPATVTRLLDHFQQPDNIFTASYRDLRQIGLKQTQVEALLAPHDGEGTLMDLCSAWIKQPDNHLLHRQHPHYPPQLLEISDPPTVLYVTGDPETLLSPAIAMVGSRKCSSAGAALAHQIASGLAGFGITVSSGLALGIDYAAQRAAVDTGGLTIAVCGTGLGRIYPARHLPLAQDIAVSGALVSELPLDAGPRAFHFPRRNRIISGLSLGVVVIEAALKSGSLTTAGHAREQGREVMVVPGSVNTPQARGCHALIRAGATLVETAGDIVQEVAAQIDIHPRIAAGSPPSVGNSTPPLDQDLSNLLKILDFNPVTVDFLVSETKLTAPRLITLLTQLELQGYVACLSTGRYIRC